MASAERRWQKGDRVWLLPDADKREVRSKVPGVVADVLISGRVRVVYMDQRCMLVKTVLPKRLEDRELPCLELKAKGKE